MQFEQKDLEALLQSDSKNLASLVVLYRVLGTFKNEAKLSMKELMRRKVNGDEFDFQSFINEEIKKNPTINIPDKKDMQYKLSSIVTKTIMSAMTMPESENCDEDYND